MLMALTDISDDRQRAFAFNEKGELDLIENVYFQASFDYDSALALVTLLTKTSPLTPIETSLVETLNTEINEWLTAHPRD
jgi:hypothetical protein